MENSIHFKIDLPSEVLKKIEQVIIDTVTKTIQQHVTSIKTEPRMFTRKEAANALRVTLPTLRIYELQGKLIPKRAGKRVLYKKEDIENFIDSLKR
jgi:lipoate-protein ligase A